MGLLSGSASICRFNVTSRPEEPDFELAAFREIEPGSEVRERVGFVPFELEEPYRVGQSRFAFRVRIDKLKADPTSVKERLRGLIRSETEATGASFVGPKKKRELRQLAEEELLVKASPQSRIVECCLDGDVLYAATTAKSHLGTVANLLRQVQVIADFKTPWIDRNEPEFQSEVYETYEPGHSVIGCRFLRELLGDKEILFEPESGHVRLQTRRARVTLTGAVLHDLHQYVERGAEVLSAKLLTGESTFQLDGASFRISNLKIEAGRHDHWTLLLDARLEKIAEAFELLDRKYADLAKRIWA